jgi:hypothetical protein
MFSVIHMNVCRDEIIHEICLHEILIMGCCFHMVCIGAHNSAEFVIPETIYQITPRLIV